MIANSMFIQLPDELQIKILGELPTLDLLKATMVHTYIFYAYHSTYSDPPFNFMYKGVPQMERPSI